MFIYRPINIRQIVVTATNKRVVRILRDNGINYRNMGFVNRRGRRRREVSSRDHNMTGIEGQTYNKLFNGRANHSQKTGR